MKALVIYYSYTGNTKKIAEDLAKKESADIIEVKETRRRGKFLAFTSGCFAALKGKAWKVFPFEKNLNDYEHITVLAPVWAGNPAPAANAIWSKLPAGKKVSVILVSGSGKSECRERVEKFISDCGCQLESYKDMKG